MVATLLPTRVGWNNIASSVGVTLVAPAHLPGDLLFVNVGASYLPAVGAPAGWNRLGDDAVTNPNAPSYPCGFWRFADGTSADNFVTASSGWSPYTTFISMIVWRGLKIQAPVAARHGTIGAITYPTYSFTLGGGLQFFNAHTWGQTLTPGGNWNTTVNNNSAVDGSCFYSEAYNASAVPTTFGGQSQTGGGSGTVYAMAFFEALPISAKARMLVG